MSKMAVRGIGSYRRTQADCYGREDFRVSAGLGSGRGGSGHEWVQCQQAVALSSRSLDRCLVRSTSPTRGIAIDFT